eukprot:5466282-Prymnesium_polylepis.1
MHHPHELRAHGPLEHRLQRVARARLAHGAVHGLEPLAQPMHHLDWRARPEAARIARIGWRRPVCRAIRVEVGAHERHELARARVRLHQPVGLARDRLRSAQQLVVPQHHRAR